MTSVPAAENTLAILRALAGRGASSATTLAADTHLPRSTVYHLLAVLRDTGFVVHLVQDRRWALGPSAIEIGMAALRHDPREALARPHLAALADATRETAHLGVLQGAEVLYLLKESPRGIRETHALITAVGVRLPAATTASGRALLAALSADQVRALTATPTAFVSRTDRGPRTLSALRTILNRERRQGYSVEVGEVVSGYASVAAAAISDDGQPIASVSVTVRSDDADFATRCPELAAAVLVAAQRIGRAGRTSAALR
ncbi:MAG: IclR family transcriptional regulator [Candidatus Nanopelagicales bacterium]|jgi:DNA-binding IclR family transcriptional regulator|nr:IclR family transcriptional regulator [Candidatus Nanopelagicales bacterium]